MLMVQAWATLLSLKSKKLLFFAVSRSTMGLSGLLSSLGPWRPGKSTCFAFVLSVPAPCFPPILSAVEALVVQLCLLFYLHSAS